MVGHLLLPDAMPALSAVHLLPRRIRNQARCHLLPAAGFFFFAWIPRGWPRPRQPGRMASSLTRISNRIAKGNSGQSDLSPRREEVVGADASSFPQRGVRRGPRSGRKANCLAFRATNARRAVAAERPDEGLLVQAQCAGAQRALKELIRPSAMRTNCVLGPWQPMVCTLTRAPSNSSDSVSARSSA